MNTPVDPRYNFPQQPNPQAQYPQQNTMQQPNCGQVDINASRGAMQGGSSKTHKVPQGGEFIYFCPPRANGMLNFYRTYLHWNIDPNGPVVCLRFHNQRCPTCEANSELQRLKDVNKDAKDLSSKIYGKETFVYNVIGHLQYDRMNNMLYFQPKSQEDKPKVEIFPISKKLNEPIWQFVSQYGNIFDFNNLPGAIQMNVMDSGGFKKYFPTFASMPGVKLHPEVLALLNNLPDPAEGYKNLLPEDQMRVLTDGVLAGFRASMRVGVSVPSMPPAVQPAPMVPNYPQNQQPLPNYPTGGYTPPAPPSYQPPPVPNHVPVNYQPPVVPMVNAPSNVTPMTQPVNNDPLATFERDIGNRNR